MTAPAPDTKKKELSDLFRAVNECSGNDVSGVLKFDVATFDAAKVMVDLRKVDAEARCGGTQRTYSTSRESAVTLFRDFVAKDEQTQPCFADSLTEAQRAELDAIVSNPDNLGVFASVFDPAGDNLEACAYATFQIYRGDGQLVDVKFNFTD
jgi:hypothetical protein